MKSITTPLARRLEVAWAAYQTARTQGVVHALPFLRRWLRLRQALEAAIHGEAFVIVLPNTHEASIALGSMEGGAQ